MGGVLQKHLSCSFSWEQEDPQAMNLLFNQSMYFFLMKALFALWAVEMKNHQQSFKSLICVNEYSTQVLLFSAFRENPK